MKKRNWYAISNKSGEVPEIFIYDEIGGWGIWASELIAQLAAIDAPRIKVRIFSPGGFVDEGVAIFNALRKHDAAIDVEIDSLAASIASVVAMAGDTITIAENARMMIHDPWGAAIGTAEDMRKSADVMDIYRDSIVSTYAARTGLPRAEIEDLMAAETWFTAEAAVEKGLADSIDSIAPAPQAQNRFAGCIMNSLKNVPEDLQSMFPSEERAATQMLSPTMLESLKKGEPAELLAPLPATNSDGSGHRDQGKKGGYSMNLEELKAQIKQAGVDVDGLQNKVTDLTNQLATVTTSLDEIKAVIGDRSHDEVKTALATADTYRKDMVDSIVASRRTLGMTGDKPEDIQAAESLYAAYSLDQLKAESTSLADAAQANEQLKPAASNKKPDDKSDNKYID